MKVVETGICGEELMQGVRRTTFNTGRGFSCLRLPLLGLKE